MPITTNVPPPPDPDEMSIDEFREAVERTEVRCELCSYKAHSIVRHLKNRHQLSVGSYKKQFPSAQVLSAVTNEMLRRVTRRPMATTTLENLLPRLGPAAARSDYDAEFERMAKTRTYDQGLLGLVPRRDPLFFFTEETRALIYAIVAGKTVNIEGPTGCGKTELIMQVHAALGWPIQRKNLNGETTRADFVGQTEANQAGTFFSKGALLRAMSWGYPILCDEVDYTPPPIAATLHPTMEGEKSIYIPETGETIKAKEGFTVFATMNTGGKGDRTGQYTGTEVQNAAFLDRFAVKLRMTYLPPAKEIEIIAAKFPLVENLANMVKLANQIREGFIIGDLSVTLSTRKLMDYAHMWGTFGHKTAIKMTLLNWLDKDELNAVVEIMKKCQVAV